MAFAQYSRYMFYPGGGLAVDEPVEVMQCGSNFMPPLFADAAGTTPIENPVTTDSEGLLSFYAPPGVYAAMFAGESFMIDVDPAETSRVLSGLYVHEQETPASTWTIHHGFGVRPQVTVLAMGEAQSTAVTHPDEKNVVITFAAPATGTALLRR